MSTCPHHGRCSPLVLNFPPSLREWLVQTRTTLRAEHNDPFASFSSVLRLVLQNKLPSSISFWNPTTVERLTVFNAYLPRCAIAHLRSLSPGNITGLVRLLCLGKPPANWTPWTPHAEDQNRIKWTRSPSAAKPGRIRKDIPLNLAPKVKGAHWDAASLAELLAARESGATFRQLAEIYHLTPARVSQLVAQARAGVVRCAKRGRPKPEKEWLGDLD